MTWRKRTIGVSTKYSERKSVAKEIILKFSEEDAEEIFELLRKLVKEQDQEESDEPRSTTTRRRKNVKKQPGNSDE
jgi:lipoprotein NlpI